MSADTIYPNWADKGLGPLPGSHCGPLSTEAHQENTGLDLGQNSRFIQARFKRQSDNHGLLFSGKSLSLSEPHLFQL